MKSLLILLLICTNFWSLASTTDLFEILSDENSFSHELMWNSGRIGGELYTYARIEDFKAEERWITKKDILKVVNKEVSNMIKNDELFRHDNEKISNLFDLISSIHYDVTFKTGEYAHYRPNTYSSDQIEFDLINILKHHIKDEVIYRDLLKNARYAYLRTWNTYSEYDGMEKFFIFINDKVIILSINNCGGC